MIKVAQGCLGDEEGENNGESQISEQENPEILGD